MTKLTKRALLVVVAIVCVLTLTLAACQSTATLTFVGGEGAIGTPPRAITAKVGEEITLPENSFTKDGHTFAGWKIGNKTLSVGDKYILNADAQAVAQWTKNGTPEPETVTLYFHNVDGWEAVAAYSWCGEGANEVKLLGTWPGSAMTAVAGHEGWMQVAIEKSALDNDGIQIVFNNNDNGSQTKNLTLDKANAYFTKNSAYASFAAAEAEVPPANTVLYFYNADGWSEVRVHSWIDGAGDLTGGWPGKVATAVDGHEGWVSYEFDRKVDEEGFKVIFHNNSGTQTANLDVIGENIYFINAQTNYAYASFAAAEAAVTPPPSGDEYNVTWIKSATDSQIDSVVGTLPADGKKTEGATITMPAADSLTLAHYTLSKWRVHEYVVEGSSGSWVMLENVNPGETYTMPAKDIQIKAVWVKNKVTISFDANGGTGTMASIQKDFATNLALTTSAFDCKFTAPANTEFGGWALTANGEAIANGTNLSAEIVSAEDTLTLYAVWKTAAVPTTPLIDDIKGSWTATSHTIDIIEGTDDTNLYIKGYAVLDGKYYLEILDNEGSYFAYSLDYAVFYTVTLSEGNLTLEPEEGSALTLSGKTALTNAARATFEGNWVKPDVSQKWIITADEVYYGVDLKKVSTSKVIGNYIAIVYENSGYSYVYVLAKQEANLEGWYVAPEQDPDAVTFVHGNYLTLIVEGKLNQTVNSGSAPDASKITAPQAPVGQVFDKWVLVGTETEFVLTDAMTENASIEATFKAPSDTVKIFVGTANVEGFSITKIIINEETGEITVTSSNVDHKVTSVFDETENGYKLTAVSSIFGASTVWLVISDDGNTLGIYDDFNGPDEIYGSLSKN